MMQMVMHFVYDVKTGSETTLDTQTFSGMFKLITRIGKKNLTSKEVERLLAVVWINI